MTTILIVAIITAVAYYIYYLSHGNHEQTQTEPTFPPEKLMDLKTTTVADRQHVYKRGFIKQLQFDELQRRAEEFGDTETLEAIRLGTYDGPLPEFKDDALTSSPQIVIGGGDDDAKVQMLEHFCLVDHGYHVTLWPKDFNQFEVVQFNITGMSYRENIDDYLGEFKGTQEAEPNNEYDPNAIKVLAADGHHVGYVPKDMTKEVRDNAQLPCPCFCYIGENDGIYFSECYITIHE